MTKPNPKRLILAGGQVLDVSRSRIAKADIAVAGNLIDEIGPNLDGGSIIDCSEMTLVPGLIDCHAHMAFASFTEEEDRPPTYRLLEALPGLEASLRSGVTTVRDAWGADAGLRDAIEAGFVRGPRLLVSLAQLGGTASIGDHFDQTTGDVARYLGSPWLPRGVFDGADEARRAVRAMVRSGADVIKIVVTGSATQLEALDRQQIADDELEEIVAEAGRQGVHVMAHAHGARGVEAAARAGVRSVEHGWFLDESAVEALVEHGTWLVPTLSPVMSLDITEESPEWMLIGIESAQASFKLALDAGVKFAMGTDTPANANRLAELKYMHDLGMDTYDVWHSATLGAAHLLDRDDLGELSAGRRADVVGIEGDLADFETLSERIRLVIKDGVRVEL